MSRKSGAFPARIRSQKAHPTHPEMVRGSPSLHLFLGVRFPMVSILANVLSVAIVVPVQLTEYKSVCSYPAHLFIDVLAKVCDVKNATTVVQARINQVLPQAFQQG
jgi:hypothetical protein